MKLSKIASIAVAGTALAFFIGCGSDSDSNNNNITSGYKAGKISGKVSDGPIGNAQVCIDLNLNGQCDNDEPFTLTSDDNNSRGEFTLDYIAKNDQPIVLISEADNANDPQDHNGSENNLSFYMVSYGQNGNYDVNPSKMLEYLDTLGIKEYVLNELNISDINETNTKDVFDKLSSKKTDLKTVIKKALQVKANFKLNKEVFSSAKEALQLSDGTEISIVEVNTSKEDDVNITEISQLMPDKATPNVVPVGDNVAITVTNKLHDTKKDDNTSDIYYQISKNTNDDTNQSPVVLAKPIFNLITDIKDKIHAILSSSFDSSNTLYITPYNSVLEIPKYHELTDMGYKPLIAADITVKDSKGVKLSLNELNVSSGIIVDDRKEMINTNETLYYLYFDGNNWVDDNITVDTDGWEKFSSKLKLAPYVIATKDNFKEVNITVENNDIVKNALIVAKGVAEANTTGTSSRILAKAENSAGVTLDYQPINGNVITFKVPKDFNVTQVVILDKNLVEIGSEAVVSLDVNDSKVDVTDAVTTVLSGETKKLILHELYYPLSTISYIDFSMDYDLKNYKFDDNSTFSEKFFDVVSKCLEGNCSDVNNTLESFEFSKEYNSSSEENETITYTYKVTTTPTKIEISITETEGNEVETATDTFEFKNHKITENYKDDEETSSWTYKCYDGNLSNIVISGHINSSYTCDESDSTTKKNFDVVGRGKIENNNFTPTYLKLAGNGSYEYNGELVKFDGIIAKEGYEITELDGEYYVKTDAFEVSGKYINKDGNTVITKQSTQELPYAIVEYDEYSDSYRIINIAGKDINVTNWEVTCNFNLSYDGGNAAGSVNFDCKSGKVSGTVNGQSYSDDLNASSYPSEYCSFVIPQNSDIPFNGYAYEVESDDIEGSETCTYTFHTQNSGDIKIPVTVKFY